MKLRRFAASTAIASVLVLGAFTTANADATDLGDFTVGSTVTFTFDCPNDGNDFFLFINPDTPEQSKVDEQSIDASADYLLGYQYDTSLLVPGEYSVGIECFESEGIYDFTFTVIPVDPCAPVDTTPVPKGAGRAPHGEQVDCAGSAGAIPDTGSSATTILTIGALAIVAGAGLLITRRRTLA